MGVVAMSNRYGLTFYIKIRNNNFVSYMGYDEALI